MDNNCKPRTQGGNPYCPTHQSPAAAWPCKYASNEAIFKFAWCAANARGEQGARVRAGLKALDDAGRLLPAKPHLHWGDQRSAAWDRLAEHPLWRACFDDERPLIDAMMDRMDRLAELEATVNELQKAPADPGMCGALAEDGPCVLPRGHNMGRADVPDNHRTELPGERPWMLPLTTQHNNQVATTDLHSVRHRRVKHCSNYPFCAVDPNQRESIPPNTKLNLRHAHGRSHFYSADCLELGCIDPVDPGEGVSSDEPEEA